MSTKTTTLGTLLYSKPNLISVSSDTSVAQAMTVMEQKKVRQLGITEINDEGQDKVIGILNLMSCITYLSFGELSFMDTSQNEEPTLDKVTVKEMLALNEESSRLWQRQSTDKVKSVYDVMSKGVHSVVVHCGDHDKLATQTDVLRYLANTLQEHKASGALPDVTKTLQELGCAEQRVVRSIGHKDPALDGFRMMVQHEVSAVAILDCAGRVMSQISTSDARYVKAALLHQLKLPVCDFLQLAHENQQCMCVKRPCYVKQDSTLEQTIQRFIVGKVHRLWVVDDERKPLTVFSLSDLIGLFFQPAFKRGK